MTFTRTTKSVVTGQAPVTLELRNTSGKKHKQTKGGTRIPGISQLTQFMPPPETCKSEIGSQPTMCQVHTGAYVSLLAPGKTDYIYRLPPKEDYHVYIARSTYHYAYARQTQRKSIGRKKQRREKKNKEKKRRESEKRKWKRKTRKGKKNKKRQEDKKRKQGKEKRKKGKEKKCHISRP